MNKINSIRRLLLFVAGFLMTAVSYAQTTVSGNVTDDTGEPVIGASVMIVGTSTGTVTDFDGNYSISKVDQNASLQVSYIGYKTEKVAVNGRTKIDIQLKPDNEVLDEVIVVGYAVGSKRTVSGAIDRVKKEDMNKGIVSSPADALKGKVAGVVITQSGGDPMGGTNIRVRGTTSLSGGNDPLVIIDGVFSDMTMFNALAPNDIESMTILKDASETAQYGSRGASGVIVVTTTKGKMGFSNISYSGQFGVNTVYKNLEMLSAADYRKQPMPSA